ncbi:MAG TPA: DUF2207 domain-containing protein, partial [Terriglobales bacterium]|nr:DUF2207 domain-containing protein [Terriglobales bacterium]
MKMRTLVSLSLLLAAAALSAQTLEESPAREQILSFHSEVTVQAEGALLVRETIRVRALGEQIRHGIYRDFPTDYKDKYSNRYRVRFQFLGALRDGRSEDFRLEDQSNGVRIYLGRSDVLLDPGVYTYTLDYRVERELGFFPGYDELYWNVNGTGWDFPVLAASATVHLPG